MDREANGVVLFHSVHSLFLLREELQRRNVAARAVPPPRHLSSDCGSALLFPMAALAIVRSVVAEQELDVRGIHELNE